MSPPPAEPIPTIEFHGGTIRIRHASPTWAESVLRNTACRWDDRDDVFRCDAIHAVKIATRIDELKLAGTIDWRINTISPTVRDDDPSPSRLSIIGKNQPPLRPDQTIAVDSFFAGRRRGLIVMPTGTGKTVVALQCIIQCATSVLIVVPVRDLMYQWHDRISQTTGINAGLIGDGVHRVSPVSVTTYDSAAIHMPRLGDRFSLLIFDEVHHLAGHWRSDAARMSTAPYRLGLTATPPTDPSRLNFLIDFVGPVLYRQDIAAAAGQTLADYTVRRIAVQMNAPELAAYREHAQTIQQFVAERRGEDPKFVWEDAHKMTAVADIDPELGRAAAVAVAAFRAKRKIEEQTQSKMRALEDLLRLHAGSPVIVFTGSNAMARKISLRFMVPCLLSHSGKKERRQYLSGFAAGQYPVLVANRVLDEGVDLPTVKVAIVVGGLSSQRQAIQRLGRVLRKGDRGERAVLYEIVTADSGEVQRSRDRRRNTAYKPAANPAGKTAVISAAEVVGKPAAVSKP